MQTESEQLFEESKKYIPGGVNSPVRAFGSVGRSPIFIKKAKGSRMFMGTGNSRTCKGDGNRSSEGGLR